MNLIISKSLHVLQQWVEQRSKYICIVENQGGWELVGENHCGGMQYKQRMGRREEKSVVLDCNYRC